MAGLSIDALPAIMTSAHQPVMLQEVVEFLAPRTGGRSLDCTFGGGGHTRALLEAAPGVTVIALDRDPAAQDRAHALRETFPENFTLLDRDFGGLDTLPLKDFDGILFDLGVSSFQLDDAERGFSFRSDAPADMRMDPRSGVPASEWLETVAPETLAHALRFYGEDPEWRRVARAILDARGSGALGRTTALAEVISAAIPAWRRRQQRIHPATLSFQAIRIAVNDECGALERALPAAFERLAPAGVLCVISFHSLEDRPVKHFFRRACGQPEGIMDDRPQDLRVKSAEPLTRHPARPTALEVATNPRSRSAKLRAIRKL